MINNIRLGIGIIIAVAVNMTLFGAILLMSCVVYPVTVIAWLITPSDIRTRTMWPRDYAEMLSDTIRF